MVEQGSTEWRDLAHGFGRAELEAILRTLEHDQGVFAGKPTDPIVKPPATIAEALCPVPIMTQFRDCIASRQALGKHKVAPDSGKTPSPI